MAYVDGFVAAVPTAKRENMPKMRPLCSRSMGR
jgi:uncharacterized protein YbaA (DUF1428 family)